jgi:hypothetical protein
MVSTEHLDVETITTKIPLSIQGYRQEQVGEALAWIASAEGKVGAREVRLRIVFRPDPNGFLRLESITGEGVANLALWFSSDKGVIESVFGPVYDTP